MSDRRTGTDRRDPNGADTATTKPSNPKDLAAFGKRIAFSVIPFRVLAGLALALAEGAYKYGRHNYRPAGVRVCTYVDATLRHLFAYVEGQDIDPQSGFHHVDKALASLTVLRDGLYQGNVEDDRPPAVEGDFIKDANASYEALAVRMRGEFGEAKLPFTEVGQRKYFLERERLEDPLGVNCEVTIRAPDGTTEDASAHAVRVAASELLGVDSVAARASKAERTAEARAKLALNGRPCDWTPACVKPVGPFSTYCEGECQDVDGNLLYRIGS